VDVCAGHIAFLDEKFPTGQHRNTHDTDDVQHRMSNGFGPILRQGQ
jgi:hypothetical protein